MRKILLLAFCVATCIIASAQLSKNNILIGGTLGFHSSRDIDANQSHYKQFSINPSIARFYRNNNAAGIQLSYLESRSDNYYDSRDKNYGAGIFLRQYRSLGKSFFVFAQEDLMVSFGKVTSSSEIAQRWESVRKFTTSITFYPGIAYSINHKFLLEVAMPRLFSVMYARAKHANLEGTLASNYTNRQFSILTGFQENILGNLSFGIKYVLRAN